MDTKVYHKKVYTWRRVGAGWSYQKINIKQALALVSHNKSVIIQLPMGATGWNATGHLVPTRRQAGQSIITCSKPGIRRSASWVA